MTACLASASVRDLCMLGDRRLTEETSKAFKKDKKITKVLETNTHSCNTVFQHHVSLFQGIAFPTCLSVNHAICHFSPLVSEADQTLEEGDMVKIDLGAHIDGYIAVVAHTVVVGGGVITGETGIVQSETEMKCL